MIKKKIFIGVDIGLNGAISAVHEDDTVDLYKIPLIATKISDIDLFKIFEKYSDYEIYIMLEEVHSLYGMSAKSNFSFGATFGKKLMIGAICGYLYNSKLDLVTPKKWQSAIWTSTDKVFKGGKKVDTKKTSLLAAKRLFPQETFLATSRSRVPHDGMVDATLIALFCKLKYFK